MSDPFSYPFVRCINFHHTPRNQFAALENLLAKLSADFSPVTPTDLSEYCDTGTWKKPKPGLIPAFYNGYRNNYDVAYKILEKVGLVGWFFVVTDCINLPAKDQLEFAKTHKFNTISQEYPDLRQVLSRDEIKEISQHHIICSHTASHCTVLDDRTDDDVMYHEIVHSSEVLSEITGSVPPAFCWLFGEPYQSSPKSHKFLNQAGYKFLFGSRFIEVLP